MAIISKELTITAYNSNTGVYEYNFGAAVLTNANGIDLSDIPSYTPAVDGSGNPTDIIVASPKTAGSLDGNVIHWITWASGTWTLYLGSEGHLGKFSVVIKTL